LLAEDFTIEVVARRLIRARIHSLASPEAAVEYARVLGRLADENAAHGPVLCADHRPVIVYSPPVADTLTQLFLRMNAVLTRVAILVAPSNATLLMQLGRIVREAGNPSRRVFTDAGAARRFLDEVLEAETRRDLATFLG
jgi:hypothetical protein